MKLRFAGCVYAAILLIDGATGLLAQEKTFELGLGIATIAACGGFAAISGSSAATAATFSAVAYPEMRRFGYPQRDCGWWHTGRDAASVNSARRLRHYYRTGYR